jgi:hypothetical protein
MNVTSGSDTTVFQRNVGFLAGFHIISRPLFPWQNGFYRGHLRTGSQAKTDFERYLSGSH